MTMLFVGKVSEISLKGEGATVYVDPPGAQRQRLWFDVSIAYAQSLKIGEEVFAFPASRLPFEGVKP